MGVGIYLVCIATEGEREIEVLDFAWSAMSPAGKVSGFYREGNEWYSTVLDFFSSLFFVNKDVFGSTSITRVYMEHYVVN